MKESIKISKKILDRVRKYVRESDPAVQISAYVDSRLREALDRDEKIRQKKKESQ